MAPVVISYLFVSYAVFLTREYGVPYGSHGTSTITSLERWLIDEYLVYQCVQAVFLISYRKVGYALLLCYVVRSSSYPKHHLKTSKGIREYALQ